MKHLKLYFYFVLSTALFISCQSNEELTEFPLTNDSAGTFEEHLLILKSGGHNDCLIKNGLSYRNHVKIESASTRSLDDFITNYQNETSVFSVEYSNDEDINLFEIKIIEIVPTRSFPEYDNRIKDYLQTVLPKYDQSKIVKYEFEWDYNGQTLFSTALIDQEEGIIYDNLISQINVITITHKTNFECIPTTLRSASEGDILQSGSVSSAQLPNDPKRVEAMEERSMELTTAFNVVKAYACVWTFIEGEKTGTTYKILYPNYLARYRAEDGYSADAGIKDLGCDERFALFRYALMVANKKKFQLMPLGTGWSWPAGARGENGMITMLAESMR